MPRGRKPKLNGEQRADAARRYGEGEDISALSGEFAVTPETIRRIAREQQVRRVRPRKLTPERIEEAQERFRNGESVQAIAARFGVTARYLRARAALKANRRVLTEAEKDAIRQQYQEGGRVDAIAAQWGIRRQTLYRAVLPGISKDASRRRRRHAEWHREACRMAAAGRKAEEIAAHFGVALHSVYHVLSRYRRRAAAARMEWNAAGLRRLREQMQLSQAELARRIGQPDVDKIRQWESGQRVPSTVYVLRLLLVLMAQPTDLLRERKNSPDEDGE